METATGIEARTGETRQGLDPKDESPMPQAGAKTMSVREASTDHDWRLMMREGWPDGFHVEYDDADDDFTICWPDGRYLVAHRNGSLIAGQTPQSLGVAPVSTTIEAILDAVATPATSGD